MTWNSSISNTTSINYKDPALFRDELMEIYVWPFIFVVIYAVVGFFGNLLVLYIYYFRWSHTKTRLFILALAVFDFINSCFNMPVEAAILWDPMQFDNNILCKATRGITFITNDISACILVAIAIDRVLCVYKPIKRRASTMLYAQRSCIIAVIIGSSVSWPGFVLYGTATLPERLEKVTVLGKTCYVADIYLTENTHWPFIFHTILFILMILIFLIFTVLYIMIGRKLYIISKGNIDVNSAKRKRSFVESFISLTQGRVGSESDQPFERRTSVSFTVTDSVNQSNGTGTPRGRPRMSRRVSGTNLTASRNNTIAMAMITMAYMISFLPYLVIVTIRNIDDKFYLMLSKNERIAYHVFLRQYFLNSVINPFIYSFTNKQFRVTVVKTFRAAIERLKKHEPTFV